MCLCIYHENFIGAVDALHKYLPNSPAYKNGFVRQFLCEDTVADCWLMKCESCTGISIGKLSAFVGDVPLDSAVKYPIWKKNAASNRFEKRIEDGKLVELLTHIAAMSTQFLKHSYVKRSQSDTFNKFDRPRASEEKYTVEGLLQIDFAENFVCQFQDEIQVAHWNQKQVSLFTSALYFNGQFHAKVLVSDCTIHTKDTIVTYLCKILDVLPPSLKILKIWSDGPSSQFKNKFIAALIPILENRYGLKIVWNYFATAHGKGCIDGIGATVKCVVRKHILARDCVVNNASDLVAAFKRTASRILVEEVGDKDFAAQNKALNVTKLFKEARDVRAIKSAHQIQFTDGKISIYTTSNDGYSH